MNQLAALGRIGRVSASEIARILLEIAAGRRSNERKREREREKDRA
jgi:hypothetical protein